MFGFQDICLKLNERARWLNRSLQQLYPLQEHQIEELSTQKSTFIRTKNQVSDQSNWF